ncbi:MAG: GyrI-like domain-containing protein [Candidatus Dormibacteraeota bacterium]|nr:GyrI-like domain-containing protein [Candidatus Dormibacteraeota bacterium]
MGQQTPLRLEVAEVAGRRIAGIRRQGPYDRISETFVKLFPVVESLGLAPDQVQGAEYVAVYFDDPDHTPAEQLRSLAGVTVADEAAIGELQEQRMPPGRYARMTFVGSHAALGEAWTEFGRLFDEAGYERGLGASYEVYVQTDPSTSPDQARTDIYQAIP